MQHLDVKADIAAGTDPGVITGYGAIFGNEDLGGDVVIKGAFADSLNSGRKVRMFWQHDMTQPVGVWDAVAEDAKGLRVTGRLALDTQLGREAHALVKMGALDEFSIGYRAITTSFAQGGARLIEKADLFEVSLVSMAMNPMAKIDAVKAAAMTERELERRLMQDAGLTRSVARALMRDGIKGLGMQDAVDDLGDLVHALKALANMQTHIIEVKR